MFATWRNYDEPALPREDGIAYCVAAEQFTDMRDVAHMMFEGPASFLGAYYPFSAQAQFTLLAGARTGELQHLEHSQR